MDQRKPDEPGYLLGSVLIALLVALTVAALFVGMSTQRPAPPGPGPVLMGAALVALGLMFLASYYVPHRSFFLRLLLTFSGGFSTSRDKRMTLLLCFVCVMTGLAAIADGLGLR